MRAIVESTEHGLYCAAGDFHVDPWLPVERAVITHAHGDHARPGSGAYLCARPGEALLRERLGPAAKLEALAYGEARTIGGARVSLHPAGHVLGSAQVRIEVEGETWVLSGDYKLQADPTCAPFEPVRCDVFVSESTFGLPIYRWDEPGRTLAAIEAWWRDNQASERTSVLYAYAVGKAQRVLASIDRTIGPILVHGTIQRYSPIYAAAGVELAHAEHATDELAKRTRGRALVIAPPLAMSSPWLRKFAPHAQALASGWMQLRGPRRRKALERGFALSDHADWPGLLAAIEATGAERVLVTHGTADALARWLVERGLESGVLSTHFEGEAGAESEPEEGAAT